MHTPLEFTLAQNIVGGQVNAVKKAPTDQSSNQGQWGLIDQEFVEQSPNETRKFYFKKMVDI
jgi:hypothetical protein